MSILTVNTGSFSVRLNLFLLDDEQHLNIVGGEHYEPGAGEPEQLLRQFLRRPAPSVKIIAHRLVHGGSRLTASRLLDPEVEREIGRLIPLAPLHNPNALKWIEAARTVLGAGVPQVAVFDTAFYANLPEVARTYAIPRELSLKHELRRYGFHGLAHEAMVRRWQQLRPETADRGRTISLQLGAGCSVTAVDRGTPVDTSMGFSPLEGLMMATRSGDIDPGLVTFLQRREGLTPEQTDRLLNERSGLLGVSGVSADMRELLESGDPRARLAVDLYCYRARKYLGAYLAVLGGADAILFGGGVGENAPLVRAQILENMGWAGVALESAENLAAAGVERRISRADSPVEVWVIPVDEAAILAREALAAMRKHSGGKQT
jgi:acetate kinase